MLRKPRKLIGLIPKQACHLNLSGASCSLPPASVRRFGQSCTLYGSSGGGLLKWQDTMDNLVMHSVQSQQHQFFNFSNTTGARRLTLNDCKASRCGPLQFRPHVSEMASALLSSPCSGHPKLPPHCAILPSVARQLRCTSRLPCTITLLVFSSRDWRNVSALRMPQGLFAELSRRHGACHHLPLLTTVPKSREYPCA
jgi:hypothetical protein